MTTRHFRAHQRLGAKLPITVTSTQRSVAARGSTIDLGLGGAACELDAPLRLGESVQVVITFSCPHVLSAEVAWVAWADGSKVRLGLRFSPECADELTEVLEAFLQEEPVPTTESALEIA